MIGLTATIPLEILVATGRQPYDLNRLFLNNGDPTGLIDEAHIAGFPPQVGNSTKGIYAAALRNGVRELIVATGGNHNDSRSLMEFLSLHNVKVIPFNYPADRSTDSLALEIKKLARYFHASPVEINQARIRLNGIREKIHEIDRLSWEENKVSGSENHHYLLASADMQGDLDQFEKDLDQFLKKLSRRQPRNETVRLAYLGAPTLYSNLYETFEEFGGRVVYNEAQHQASMPDMCDSLVEQYCNFTPAYDIFTRLKEIKNQLEKRQITGIIHGLQSPRSSQVDDLILRQRLKLPLLTLSADRLGPVDAHSRMQVAEFINQLQEQSNR